MSQIFLIIWNCRPDDRKGNGYIFSCAAVDANVFPVDRDARNVAFTLATILATRADVPVFAASVPASEAAVSSYADTVVANALVVLRSVTVLLSAHRFPVIL